MKRSIPFIIVSLCCLFPQTGFSRINESVVLNNEKKDKQIEKDSVITTVDVIGERDTLFHYQAAPFGYYPDSNESELLKEEKGQKVVVNKSPSTIKKVQSMAMVMPNIDQNKSVGRIPFEEGNTPSGGKTYSVPILTARVASSAPQVFLVYNSQSGNGTAGFGWNIAGTSAITVCPKTIYYDDISRPVDLSAPASCVYTLDGIRLVANNGAMTTYQYETAQGYTLVKKNLTTDGRVAYFDVLYPNGSQATFGFTTNTQMGYVYPITSIIDLKGYRIDFEYIQSGNNYYISKIKYGGKTSTTHLAEIVFQYATRTDYTPAYVSGVEISPNLLLKEIKTYNSGQELRTYTLTHALADNVQRLTQLDCSSGSSSLNPLVFNYETYYAGFEGSLAVDPYGAMLMQYFSGKAIFQRGKFVKDEFNDGITTYPNFSTYALTATKKVWVPFHYNYYYQYGSLYSPDQDFLIAPRLDYLTDMKTIKAESGFQAINNVDVDGDGVDEIVKINFNGFSGSKTILKITVYSISDGSTLSTRTFNVNVEGIVTDGDLTSPISRSYYFGDFQGTGKIQLLTVSHNKTFKDETRTSYFDLINLETGTLLNESTLFSHAPNEFVMAADVNGDGRSELCRNTSSIFEVYSLSSDNTFVSLFNASISKNSKTLYADLNGDGKLDMLTPPADSYESFIDYEIPVWAPDVCPNCRGFYPIRDIGEYTCVHCEFDFQQYYFDLGSNPHCRGCQAVLDACDGGDVDPGNLENLCCPEHGCCTFVEVSNGYVDNGNVWTAHIATGNGYTVKYNNIVNTAYRDVYYLMDINRDGLADLIQIRNNQIKPFLNINGIIQDTSMISPISIQSTTNIVPANIINYDKMSYFIRVDNALVACYSFTKDESKNNLLTSMIDSYGLIRTNSYSDMTEEYGNYSSTTTSKSYPYSSFIAPLNLLSSSVISNDNVQVSNQDYNYFGAVMHRTGLGFSGFEKVDVIDNINNMTTQETHDPQMFGVTTHVTSPIKEATYVYTRNEESNKQANPQLTYINETDKLKNNNIWGYYSYDSFNNPTNITMCYGSSDIYSAIVQTYFNSVTSSLYLIGQPLTKTVTKFRYGLSWVDNEEIAYYSNRLSQSKITYTGVSGNLKTGETQWVYDGNKNLISEKSAPYNNTLFLGKTYTYDASGRYPASETNALNQTTSCSDYDKYGNPRNAVNYKGKITTSVYDDWGQLVSTAYPDGVTENTSVAWGGNGLYTVASNATGKPATITHYDALEREMRTGHQRFNGQWQYVDKVYNSKGLLYMTSLPFRVSPSLWNTYAYDTYNRPTSITEASGKVTSWSYGAKTVTETKNGIATTKTNDISGQLISVTDPGGTIVYSIRPDGQPNTVTALDSIATLFSYDEYGRRTGITDPSAGTQTTIETYNNNLLTVTSTDAKGETITTGYDQYGRVTLVTRPEFNTSYVYNADGLLASETSTNGTSKTFSYDDFGRLTGDLENSMNGIHLTHSFSYSDGNMASKTSTGSVLGATENYTYTYGTLSEIKLNGQTSVWKLTEESDLGQPTKCQTGPLERTYGYTSYGLPTSRTAGNVQNFSYNFDPLKGNLLSRTDNTRGITESFGYDNLNRLSSINGQQMSYADNGNVTVMPGTGTLEYGYAGKPYQISVLTPSGNAVPLRSQNLTYTSFERPASIIEGTKTADFFYNAEGGRVKTYLTNGSNWYSSHFLINNEYEFWDGRDAPGTKEILYIGGDAYSAPAVLIIPYMDNLPELYYICRDYLGSITHITNASGSLTQELSYDAWGRLRNPSSQVAYAPDSVPELLLGRGYTGHEHLTMFGLINMNARLYDPALGRFLSPDPYVQAPEFTQSFNRYSYGLNNPLTYIDQNGEFWNLIIGAVIGGVVNWATHGADFSWKGLGYFGVGAVAGALSAGIGAGVSSAIAGGSFNAGFVGSSIAKTATSSFLSGAAIGGSAGFSGGFVSGFGNGLMQRQNFGQSLLSGVKDGFIGGFTGGFVGGIAGGINAVSDGRRFFDGSAVQDKMLVDQNIPIVGQRGNNNCLPASAESVDKSYGSNMTQEQVRDLPGLGGDPNTVPLEDVKAWSEYSKASGHGLSGEFDKTTSLNRMVGTMRNAGRVAVNLNTGDVGHSVIMKSIVQRTITKINGTVIQKYLYNVMNPAYGGSIMRVSGKDIINAYNIFYIIF